MYLSAGSDSRSLRDAPVPGGTRLLVGGSGHSVGRTRSELDYSPQDGVPFVGLMPRGRGQIYVATGFDKWGMTNGVAAALAISGAILGTEPEWARPTNRRSFGPSAATHLASIKRQGRCGSGGLRGRGAAS